MYNLDIPIKSSYITILNLKGVVATIVGIYLILGTITTIVQKIVGYNNFINFTFPLQFNEEFSNLLRFSFTVIILKLYFSSLLLTIIYYTGDIVLQLKSQIEKLNSKQQYLIVWQVIVHQKRYLFIKALNIAFVSFLKIAILVIILAIAFLIFYYLFNNIAIFFSFAAASSLLILTALALCEYVVYTRKVNPFTAIKISYQLFRNNISLLFNLVFFKFILIIGIVMVNNLIARLIDNDLIQNIVSSIIIGIYVYLTSTADFLTGKRSDLLNNSRN